ncbi:phosphoribosylanthranilate isomerase [Paenibacillus shirakamiensis]|uniref:N-(5'-phosphoribosyl)anthranilate isomerase n=1 Tax=Paenibacillus shirakamiensis TaxID=1265935 RepID=A0ABS4JEY2_9BACL|nr:phosphoribosylanthranilate isomerase [Paenibacillus shirakamiensis]MBP2000268.1 phosphoribosylanthranilate isomerase [Paenibacillus shirakamiensis]
MVRVKICGLTTKEAAWAAVEAGADAIGFVFAEGKRKISPYAAKEIIRSIPPYVTTTGVFVNTELGEMNQIAEFCQLDMVQLHGKETPHYCSKSIRPVVKTLHMGGLDLQPEDALIMYQNVVRAFLLDTFVQGSTGGTGQSFAWSEVKKLQSPHPLILAGGLHPENIVRALEETRLSAVDVSSGVETQGIKDPLKMNDFVKAARFQHVTAGG